MEIDHCDRLHAFRQRIQPGLHHPGLGLGKISPIPVQILAAAVGPPVAARHAVRVDQGNNQELDTAADLPGFDLARQFQQK